MTNKKRFLKNVTKAGLIFTCNVVVLVFFLFAFGREYVANHQIDQEIANLETQRVELEQGKLHTMALIDTLSSEYYLEGEGRIKHSLAKDGETLIILQGDQTETAAQGERVTGFSLGSASNARIWYFYFFNKGAFDRLSTL